MSDDLDEDLWKPGWDETPESMAEQRKLVTEQRHKRDYILRVAEETVRLRARREAQRLVDAENVTDEPIPAPTSLDDLLDEEDEQESWRMVGLWPKGGTVLLSAGAKSGKTTTTGNVVRCLADGDRLFGVHATEALPEGDTVAVLDYEMPRGKVKQWLRDQGIKNRKAVVVWTERGRAGQFDPRNEASRAKWVNALAASSVKVWIIDCLSPILSALGIDENNNTEVGAVLDGINTIAAAAEVSETLLIHHMGHGAERSRGASRLVGWPDVNWRLMWPKDDRNPNAEPDPNGPRFFAAYGRDVDVREGRLVYESSTRHLNFMEGGRKDDQATKNLGRLLVYVRDNPLLGVRKLQDGLTDKLGGRDTVRTTLKTAVEKGYVTANRVGGNALEHFVTTSGKAQIWALSVNVPEGGAVPPAPGEREPCICGYYITAEAFAAGARACIECLKAASS
uniref:AAA family ATPase n=1 Tax=Paractinoplanes polyasparticus TaxID=2856853 RepID=UPI001C84E970|nr:AAA family ATPase [Actinoplanes polyasparticus]